MAPEEETDSAGPTLPRMQEEVSAYWRRHGIVERALAGSADGPVFRFTEGPPSANGRPHAGHPIPRTMKDLQLRYRRMRGYRIVSSMAGWDCHGLPVEIEVEKRHGIRSKREIEVIGLEKFCAECRGIALSVASAWEEMSERLGYWLDYRHAYYTMSPQYIESVWWSLKTLFDRGLIEKGHYVLPYCPRCETTLSSHEVAQGYRESVDPSVTVRFPLIGSGPPRALLVWTTTPWTLPANVLITARADLTYAVVRLEDGTEGVLAESALPRYFPGGVPLIGRLTGAELAGREYLPPFPFVPARAGRFRVVLDSMVDAAEGTGLVHCAPSFGPEDQRIGAREGVGAFDPLDSRGRFTDEVPIVTGRSFKAADPILIGELEARGLLWRSETVRHTYPFCPRCESALLYRAIDSWFVRASRLADEMVRNNAEVTWIPEYLRDGRFGHFLTEAKDWALSRSRYWGTPLPIWLCPNGHARCIGSFAELAQLWGQPLPEEFDPHRAGVDPISFPCGTCGATARREPYTIDVWYDSGAAPFAQFHYPFEPGPFDPKAPLDYIAEAIDQTRGWYYTLLVLSTALFGRLAYRVCLTTGHGLDDVGRKMSKSKGNVLEPIEILTRLGGDAVRWSSLVGDFTQGVRIQPDLIRHAGARTLGTLANVAAFYRHNASADGLSAVRERPEPTDALDRWLLSRLEATRQRAEASLESYDPRPGALALREFVDDLSTWYLRRSRPRFWADRHRPQRAEAHAALSYALGILARILAPFTPFTAEWVAQQLEDEPFASADRSVHLGRWPGPCASRDEPLEEAMAELRGIVEIGRELRQRARVKSRIPLAEFAVFSVPSAALAVLGREGRELLAAELNVRHVAFDAKPDLDRYPEAGWVLRQDEERPIAAISRQPTPELLEEGLAREVLRRLQQARKEMRLQFTEAIELLIGAPEPLYSALDHRREVLADELLAGSLTLETSLLAGSPEVRAWEVEGLPFNARLIRASAPAAETRRERPARRAPARHRSKPRTSRRGSKGPAKRRAQAPPSRTSPPGTRGRSNAARRRPAAGGRRSTPVRRRSIHRARRAPRRDAPRRRRRRSVRAA